jgi:hypothetical protein
MGLLSPLLERFLLSLKPVACRVPGGCVGARCFWCWPLSYWGDEGWAAKMYVHGQYRPVVAGDTQGELEFHPATWAMALWNDQNGGNHYLFSLAQKATLDAWRAWRGLPPSAFDEAVSRLPPFAAGMGSILLAALFVRWLGRPGGGLLLGFLLAAHPWHIQSV